MKQLLASECFVFGLTLDGEGGALPFDGNFSSDQQHWLHLDYTFPDCIPTLEKLQLPEFIIEALIRDDTRPRAMPYKSGILLTLRAINKNPEATPDDMVSLRTWLHGNIMISLRHRRIQSAQQVRSDLESGSGPQNLEELLGALIENVVDRIADYVDQIEGQISLAEEQVGKDDAVVSLNKLSEIRRQAASVRRYLAPQREALEALHRNNRELLQPATLYQIQEVSDRTSRYVEDLDLVREKCLLAKEEVQNLIAQQQNARMYILSIVAAIFLPISFITGLFGMNVAGLPGLENPAAFVIVSVAMAVIVTGILTIFRKNRWM